ncbi:MAG: MFS transporter [Vulcanimicrobiaceae bacterium]
MSVATSVRSLGARLRMRPAPQEIAEPDKVGEPASSAHRVGIVAAAVLAILIDGTASGIVSQALPYLQGRSAASIDEGSWIITCFNAPYYSTILFTPWLMAAFSRRKLLVAGLLGFCLTSLLLYTVTGLSAVLILRAIQGVFLGCVFVPGALLLFGSLPIALLPLAIPAFALVALGSATLGPFIGGAIAENFSPGAIFIPGAAASLAAALIVLCLAPKGGPAEHLRSFDLLGLLLSLMLFGSLQYLANEGERRNWFDSQSVQVAVAVLAIAFPAFIAWEAWFCRCPHANLRMFSAFRNVRVGGAINVLLGAIGYSTSVFTLYLQSILASTPTLAGIAVLWRFPTYIVGIAVAFFFISRRVVGLRAVVALAAIGTAVAFITLAFRMTPTAEVATFLSISFVYGLFFSMMAQPVPSLVIGTLPMELLSSGVSVYKLTSPLGLIFATAGMQTFIDHRAALHASTLAGYTATGYTSVWNFLHHGGSVRTLSIIFAQQSQALSLSDAMILFAPIAIAIIPLVLLADVQERRPAAQDESTASRTE